MLELNGQKYPLSIKIGQLLKLQKLSDDTIGAISQRLALGSWKIEDIQNILFVALCGGGCSEAKAQEIADKYFESNALFNAVNAAGIALSTALTGAGDEEEPKGSKKKAKGS